jgi:hypothetical protein
MQYRQRKGSGLSRAGLGVGHNVSAGEHMWNGSGLNRSWLAVSSLAHRTLEQLGKPQVFKWHQEILSKTPGEDVSDAPCVWLCHRYLACTDGCMFHGMRL